MEPFSAIPVASELVNDLPKPVRKGCRSIALAAVSLHRSACSLLPVDGAMPNPTWPFEEMASASELVKPVGVRSTALAAVPDQSMAWCVVELAQPTWRVVV